MPIGNHLGSVTPCHAHSYGLQLWNLQPRGSGIGPWRPRMHADWLSAFKSHLALALLPSVSYVGRRIAVNMPYPCFYSTNTPPSYGDIVGYGMPYAHGSIRPAVNLQPHRNLLPKCSHIDWFSNPNEAHMINRIGIDCVLCVGKVILSSTKLAQN